MAPISRKQTDRTRIILETTEERKQAVLEAADLQGASLTDWLDDQLSLSLSSAVGSAAGADESLKDPAHLLDAAAVVKGLRSQDWAFTSDDTRYLTHDLHPYPAKFIPQIPANLIRRLSLPGDLVMDPFGGSATTAVEAVRLGRRAISIDANPLSTLIGRVKTGYMSPPIKRDMEQLSSALETYLVASDLAKKIDALRDTTRVWIPEIPNIEKWFEPCAIEELALIRHLIAEITDGLAKDASLLALSRIIIRVSNQDSETRYVSVKKKTSHGLTLRAFHESLKSVMRRLESASTELQFADAQFLSADSRNGLDSSVQEGSVDLIVTSPPYPNATDYHLYHRFRLFWLGYDPRELGSIEIGSHLRHQRNDTGFGEYRDDMQQVLTSCFDLLAPGRYAVFVVGDAVFKGTTFSTSAAIEDGAKTAGFKVVATIDRIIHQTKRSFAKPARRARAEQLVVLQKPPTEVSVQVLPPIYKMWGYEQGLRIEEIEALTGTCVPKSLAAKPISLRVSQPSLWNLRRLTFSSHYRLEGSQECSPTWQKSLENGDSDSKRRKDPKYVTHGIHPYKGKFYPQLAKCLINISGAKPGDRLLDPFCGSGTTLLEGMLNGLQGVGCDFHPLAAKIASAKTAILTAPRAITDHTIRCLIDKAKAFPKQPPKALSQFPDDLHDELLSWFPEPVLFKLNWILGQVRLLGDKTLVDFFEVILSSIIREVSHQDPTDLRIRRRKIPLDDAPVLDLFIERLELQHERLQAYWKIAGRRPGAIYAPKVANGDCRTSEVFDQLGLASGCIDCLVTSPPYATALPYIDTDRLSLMAVMNVPSKIRAELEERLTGSREIKRLDRIAAEQLIEDTNALQHLPRSIVAFLRKLHKVNSSNGVGFRRANMAALLLRYFSDMDSHFRQMLRLMRSGGKAYYVVGDSRTNAGDEWMIIRTCDFVAEIAANCGFNHLRSIPIDVTTENLKHLKNAITKNQILEFERP